MNLEPMNRVDLQKLAREINDREDTIASLRNQTALKANETLAEAIFQGQALLRVKSEVGSKQFLEWVCAHCAKLPPGMAIRYITVVVKLANAKQELAPADSIRTAAQLFLLDEQHEHKPKPQHSFDDIARDATNAYTNKLCDLFKDNPIDKWPAATLNEMRDDLQPIAAQLWPERFT